MDGPTKQERLTITVSGAAERLGIGRNQAYEAARRGEIPIIRIGKRMLVPLAAFEAMLAAHSKQQIVAAELVRRLQRDGASDPSPNTAEPESTTRLRPSPHSRA